MAKIKFFSYYRQSNDQNPSVGDTESGNYFGYPAVQLLNALALHDIHYTTQDDFDIIVFADLDREMLLYANALPGAVKKILFLIESRVYTPLPHTVEILTDPLWDAVLTYNREIVPQKITFYDIPVTGTQCPISPLTPLAVASPEGVFIGSYKLDMRGYALQRNVLVLECARNNDIKIFGKNWDQMKNCEGATKNKIKTISDFRYSIVIENAKCGGYVTEKLPDSILGERPTIYFGDCVNAKRRFGDTFVCLPDLSYASFLDARTELFKNYDKYYQSCLYEKAQSDKWIESYISAMLAAVL